MEFLRLIFILVVLASATTCSTQMQPSSNNPDAIDKLMANWSQTNWSQTQPAGSGGLLVRILHRNHPEVVRQLGAPAQIAHPLQVAPLEKWNNMILYYAHFLVGSEFESVLAAYDTGSSFTWLNPRKTGSSTYAPLMCRGTGSAPNPCDMVPGHTTCPGQDLCRFNMTYDDGLHVTGKAGTDSFHFFKPSTGGHDPEPSHTVEARVVFGTPDGKIRQHPGVLGVLKRGLGLLNFIGGSTFSSCFPLHDDAPSYLRLGEEAFLEGDSTPIRIVRSGHFGFLVNSITIQGVSVSTASTKQESFFLFDTGSALTHLHGKIMDIVVERVKRAVKAVPAVGSGGYELCYVPANVPALKGIELSLQLSGGGSITFKPENLWILDGVQNTCLAFFRSRRPLTIFGAWQMRGWGFGFDLARKELFFQSDDRCGT